jgi:hypothetical protein
VQHGTSDKTDKGCGRNLWMLVFSNFAVQNMCTSEETDVHMKVLVDEEFMN